jgi:maltokinase
VTSNGHSEDPGATYRSLLADYLPRRRWFPAKGRDFTISDVNPLPWLDSASDAPDQPRCRIELVTVQFGDGTADTYQVPVAYFRSETSDLDHALIGSVDDPELGQVVVYDGVFVRESVAALYDGFLSAGAGRSPRDDADLEFRTVEGRELPTPAPVGSVMSAEQSNTSIVYGDDAILKLFRRVSGGHNPDIEIHDALTRAGFENVAPLLGWMRGRWSSPDGDKQVGDLGMLQAFLRTATDGWSIALASVRDLFAEGDLHPGEVGGDFAAESERLGEAVARVHQELARLFPTGSEPDGAALADAMQARLDQAVDAVPALGELQAGLTARFDRLRTSTGPIPIQRVHGDLHLGQTLRTVKGWKLIDFEGEPAKSLAERTALSSPLRDVAGMLRSFDYAAGATLQGFGASMQLAYRAHEWSTRNRDAFLAGYGSVAGNGLAADSDLLEAFEADKAVYETVYETRNRPGWIGIPLQAIARITAEE